MTFTKDGVRSSLNIATTSTTLPYFSTARRKNTRKGIARIKWRQVNVQLYSRFGTSRARYPQRVHPRFESCSLSTESASEVKKKLLLLYECVKFAVEGRG